TPAPAPPAESAQETAETQELTPEVPQQSVPEAVPGEETSAAPVMEETPAAITPESPGEPLPQDDKVPAEILEFFVPEAEEHLQVVTHCLLSLETNPGAEQINRLLREMHTVKGSAAQVGLHRISHVAHRAEDLIGRLRDGGLRPSAEIIDICLEAVDILKKFLYRQWTGDEGREGGVEALRGGIHGMVSAEQEVVEAAGGPAATPAPVEDSHAHLMELELEEPPPVPLLADLLTTDFRKPEISDRAADKP